MAWTLNSFDFHFRIMHVMNVMMALRLCLYYFPVMWTVQDCLVFMLKSSRKNAVQLHNNIIHLVNKYLKKIYLWSPHSIPRFIPGSGNLSVNKTNFLLHGALTNQTDHYFKNSAWKQ